ncbi:MULTISPECIES: DUF3540 domain-containing protein [Sorangium]|uniref:DUF3540 domain-containing protein n=1 Tax=Sorangium cellulosum TaxID=56 RepID=A0A4P2QKC4_SORCE|nr:MULTISPECIES: DUF3540 domain-containing protein [Sorangium]AUX30365.1 hypothetical protein SOCE836_024680 [Sorangium cellulosum]WCQ89759.1 hypothetical protein NQZ70_02451 [Sorangium sp. Soce836]
MSMGAMKESDRAAAVRVDAPEGEEHAARGRGAELPRIGLARAGAAAEGEAGPGRAAALPREYLGPARVTSAEAGAIAVELPGGQPVAVQMALALPYEPALDDTLLVIGRDDAYYAIGVLHGRGRSVLSLQGDVAVHAREGALSLCGDKGVEIRGPELEVQAGKIRMVADAVVQKFASVYQRVSALLSVQASESHTVVEKTSFTKAKNATILTEETVTVNGKQILLG